MSDSAGGDRPGLHISYEEGFDLAELILGPMLRHVSATSATIWVETDAPCVVRVLDHSAPTFCVAGHHYALAIIEELRPASSYEYEVELDGEVRWPVPGSTLPASRIRTHRDDPLEVSTTRLLFGSCRTAAPHVPPWTLELETDARGRGVDALYTYGRSMLEQPEEEWPDLAIFLGDQVYADDSSPKARERIAERRRAQPRQAESGLPPKLVDGFDEYTWLYHESWSPEIERWFFSNVPSVMIFDDHEMIDDWNISDDWVRTIRQQGWWEDHVTSGLMTYWLYQHLGNLSPEVIRSEGILDALMSADDGERVLRAWAAGADEFTPASGQYRFNFVRDIGRVRLVMIDSRNGRVLDPGGRRMVTEGEWRWIVESCNADVDHLLIGTSLPVFVPGGLHDLQVWSEAICDGRWGALGRRFGRWSRIRADMEDWPSFRRSFDALAGLLRDVSDPSRPNPPATVSVLSGDIHFSYASEVRFPGRPGASSVHQLVSSPIRNALRGPEQTAMRIGTSRVALSIARFLRRAAGQPPTAEVSWKLDLGPVFANTLGKLTFERRRGHLVVLQARPHDDHAPPAFDNAFELDLGVGATAVTEPGGVGV